MKHFGGRSEEWDNMFPFNWADNRDAEPQRCGEAILNHIELRLNSLLIVIPTKRYSSSFNSLPHLQPEKK